MLTLFLVILCFRGSAKLVIQHPNVVNTEFTPDSKMQSG